MLSLARRSGPGTAILQGIRYGLAKGYDAVVVEEFSRKFFGARSSTISMTLRH